MKKEIKPNENEGSYYWKFQYNYPEVPEANPDMVAIEYSWVEGANLSIIDEENLQAYQRILSKGFIDTLAPRLQEVWKLAFLEWMRIEDIAKKLAISKSTVKTCIYRAGEKIKRAILIERGLKMNHKQQHWDNGFKKNLKVKGKTLVDKELEERLEKSKDEINKFLNKHPSLKKEVND